EMYLSLEIYLVNFFFQAEDGIRDFHVTGVQTCALPISPGVLHINILGGIEIQDDVALVREIVDDVYQYEPLVTHDGEEILFRSRSEERRVGKECRARRVQLP